MAGRYAQGGSAQKEASFIEQRRRTHAGNVTLTPGWHAAKCNGTAPAGVGKSRGNVGVAEMPPTASRSLAGRKAASERETRAVS